MSFKEPNEPIIDAKFTDLGPPEAKPFQKDESHNVSFGNVITAVRKGTSMLTKAFGMAARNVGTALMRGLEAVVDVIDAPAMNRREKEIAQQRAEHEARLKAEREASRIKEQDRAKQRKEYAEANKMGSPAWFERERKKIRKTPLELRHLMDTPEQQMANRQALDSMNLG
jgi:hypothetical protein